MGGLCGNITLGWLGQDRQDLVNKVEVSKNFVFFCLETADQIRIPSPSLCSTTTYLKSCPQVQVGTGQILGLALLEEEKVLVSLEERRLVILDSTGKVAMP